MLERGTPTVATGLDWLTARPIAHRGLHDAAQGVIENTAAAMRAAIDAGYGIEIDVQVSADGEAMVHHDDVLGRLAEGGGRLDRCSAAALRDAPFRGSPERMLTLGELCDLVDRRATLLIELKSRFDGDDRLPARVADVLAAYRGPAAPMSFDPWQIAALRHKAPQLVAGSLPPSTGRIHIGIRCRFGCATEWGISSPNWPPERNLWPMRWRICPHSRRYSHGTFLACRY